MQLASKSVHGRASEQKGRHVLRGEKSWQTRYFAQGLRQCMHQSALRFGKLVAI